MRLFTQSTWQIVVVLYVSALAGVVSIFASENPSEELRMRTLLERGVHTRALVDHISGSGAGVSSFHDVHYVFQVDGRKIEGADAAWGAEATQLSPGDSLDIVYLPEDPTVSGHRVREMLDSRGKAIPWLVAYAVLASVVATLLLVRHRALQGRRRIDSSHRRCGARRRSG